MRYLRWVGLMSSLLFVGVLGGLMAPLPSEAVPTIQVKIDGVQVAPVAAAGGAPAVPSILRTNSSTCTLAEGVLGYTACYGIRTSTTTVYSGANGRQWKIQTVPGLTARLRIADQVGQDLFSLVGVRFVPVPWTTAPQTATPEQNTNEQHIIEVILKNEFSSPVNVANSGPYVFALRIGGEFSAGPAGDNCNFVQGDFLCDAIGDKVEFSGTGIFSGTARVDILSPSGSAQNSLPLSFTVAGPHADPILSFAGVTNADMGQVDPTFPRFNCSKVGAETTCQPDITNTIKVTLKGEDTFVLVGGGDGDGSRCEITPAQQRILDRNIRILTLIVAALNNWEVAHPNAALRAFIDLLQSVLNAAQLPASDPTCPGAVFVLIAQAIQQANDQLAFIQHGAVPAVGVPATGTIRITKLTVGETSDDFTFNISGPSSSTQTIDMSGTDINSIEVTVNAGTYDITENPLPGWSPISSNCGSEGELPTIGVVVPAGGTLLCTFHNGPVVTTGTITIHKSIPGPEAHGGTVFTFNISGPSSLTSMLTISGGHIIQPIEVTVNAGTYSVEEVSNPPNWHFGSARCGDNPLGGDNPVTGVVVPAGGNVSCLFTNNFD